MNTRDKHTNHSHRLEICLFKFNIQVYQTRLEKHAMILIFGLYLVKECFSKSFDTLAFTPFYRDVEATIQPSPRIFGLVRVWVARY